MGTLEAGTFRETDSEMVRSKTLSYCIKRKLSKKVASDLELDKCQADSKFANKKHEVIYEPISITNRLRSQISDKKEKVLTTSAKESNMKSHKTNINTSTSIFEYDMSQTLRLDVKQLDVVNDENFRNHHESVERERDNEMFKRGSRSMSKIMNTRNLKRQLVSSLLFANFYIISLYALIVFNLLISGQQPKIMRSINGDESLEKSDKILSYNKITSILDYLLQNPLKFALAQSYKPEWPSAQLQQEIFLLNLEDGYFGCQVNESQDFLQLFELSRLCDGQPQCYLGSDELTNKLRCNQRDKCSQSVNLRGSIEYLPCVNGVCLDGLCYCNDGFGGKSCDVPDENECKFRPCDVFAHCTNTMGSYYCSCYPGYDGDGMHCQDINECEIPSLAALCSDNSECCNLPGHFICKCKPGYQQSGQSQSNSGAPTGANSSVSCIDIDECQDDRACGRGAICENLPGSFHCSCPPGFTGDPSVECIDMDECRNDPCGQGAQCTNIPGGYRCSCPTGFERNPLYPANLLGTHTTTSLVSTTPSQQQQVSDLTSTTVSANSQQLQARTTIGFDMLGSTMQQQPQQPSNITNLAVCLDINECALAANGMTNGSQKTPICGQNAQCVNTPGGFFCQCPPNYTGNPKVACTDIDECQAQACGPNAQCKNMPGSYKCECKPGFTGNAYSTDGCQDDDECQRKDACGLNAQCFNSMGSYECFCQSGYTGDPYTKCVDIDECLTTNPCGPGAKCVNQPGSYKCTCPDKYLARGTPEMGCERVAVDINCLTDSDCTQNAHCLNATCQCKLGFQTKGIECVDVDECSLSQPIQTVPLLPTPRPFTKLGRASAIFNSQNNHQNNSHTAICGLEANCVNTEGSFRCECKSGYEKHNPNIPTSKCRDIDECELNNKSCGPNSKCFNTDGGFKCACDDGFIPIDGDQTKGCKSPCEGVNCGQHATCRPHGVEAACVCMPGFTYDPNNIKLGCVDINECDTNYGAAGLCGQRATCTNLPGSYRCKCPNGFTGDPYRYCEDINECDRKFGVFGQCGEMAICNNTIGSFSCLCGSGFTGDPKTKCTDIDECSSRFGPSGKCGLNAICTNTPGKFTCRCPQGYSGDPNYKCVPDQPSCSTASDCPNQNHICRSGRCQCPFPQQADSTSPNECQHPCDKTECGSQATCQLDSDSQPICVCNAGYIAPSDGRSGCVDVNECIQGNALTGMTPISLNGNPRASVALANGQNSSHPCGRNALCRNQPGTFDCVCPPGYSGNAYEACVQDVTRNQQLQQPSIGQNAFGNYQQEPRTSMCNEPCPRGQVCIDGQCVSSNGAGSELTLCRNDQDCQSDQACEYLQRSSLSSSFQCVHVCELHRCGPNARCYGSNHKPICSCNLNHSGDPYDRITGCQLHVQQSQSQPQHDTSTTAAGFSSTSQSGGGSSTKPMSLSATDENDQTNSNNETPATAFEFGPPSATTSSSSSGQQRNSNGSLSQNGITYEMQTPSKRPSQSMIAYELPLPTTPLMPNFMGIGNSNANNNINNIQSTSNYGTSSTSSTNPSQSTASKLKQPSSNMISSTPGTNQQTSFTLGGYTDQPTQNNQPVNHIRQQPGQTSNERLGVHSQTLDANNVNYQPHDYHPDSNKSAMVNNNNINDNFVYNPNSVAIDHTQTRDFQKIPCNSDQHCPGNLHCLSSNDQASVFPFKTNSQQKSCGCPFGYKREGDYCFMHRTSCNGTSWCKAREECISSLIGSQQAFEFTGICICPRGYKLTSSGHLCVDRDECSEGASCASGAICQNKIGSFECLCPQGTVGEPYSKGCEPLTRQQLQQQQQMLGVQHSSDCRSNSDCSNDRECDQATHKCISPCHICGPRALCTAANHAAICLCPPRFTGNAIDPVYGCQEPLTTTTTSTTLVSNSGPITTSSNVFAQNFSTSTTTSTTTTQAPPTNHPYSSSSSSSSSSSVRTGQGSQQNPIGVPVTTLLPTTTTLAPQVGNDSSNGVTLAPMTSTTPESVEFRTIPPSELFVMCLADGIQVELQLGGFDGIIYVKGHSQDPKCRKIVSSSNPNEFVDFKVQFGHCDLIHRGGEASFVLVIQKHPKLVTYRARAYHVKCVYNTGERTITLGFNVSMITTSGTIANTGPPPTCLMSITALDGREVSSAEIGQDLLLRVDVQPDSIYGGFARSCEAKTMDDEGEYQYEVTDANGCATDPSIFSDWKFDQQRKSLVARFNAFKFPSSNNLRFQCNIRVCFGSCPPVNCNGIDSYGRRRRRREARALDFISSNSSDSGYDSSDESLVDDGDAKELVASDTLKEGALREEVQVQSNAILTFDKKESSLAQLGKPQVVEDIEFVCLPRLGIAVSILLTLLIALLALAIAIVWSHY